MRSAPLVLASLLLLLPVLLLPACKTFPFPLPPVADEQGPKVVYDATALSTQIALHATKTTKEDAIRYRAYVFDARNMLATGSPPVTVLDEIAAKLNTAITNPYVRGAIQTGILLIRNHATIPVSGLIPPETMPWIMAVLDGALAGMDLYIAAPGATPKAVKVDYLETTIKFR